METPSLLAWPRIRATIWAKMRRDLTQDLFKLLDDLRAEIVRPATFMGIALGYQKDELALKVDKIRASVPREFRDAASVARESERYLDDAKIESDAILADARAQAEKLLNQANEEAERLVEQARLQQAQLVSESEVLKIARSQADEHKGSIEKECRDMRREADRYALDVLTKLERGVSRVLSSVERGRQELDTESRGEKVRS